MEIEVRLFATLRKHLPDGSGRASAHLTMPGSASITDVLDRLGIPAETAHLVLVNGRYEADKRRVLEDGFVLSIWPPIAGG